MTKIEKIPRKIAFSLFSLTFLEFFAKKVSELIATSEG